MAIALRLRLLSSYLICVGPYYHILPLFGLLAIPIARAQDVNVLTANSRSCEGDTCSWDNEGGNARERLVSFRIVISRNYIRKYH